ncbi:hypothetical protein VTK73DRAFT_210 [Phialemonium thermophilum]|uniref:20S-pre-rRNA D-site endonuclease NOB1 n=1 Tax=Phialemonium thermophilum TaxID=223376 RepID=A0ABR3VWD8_9PEZI
MDSEEGTLPSGAPAATSAIVNEAMASGADTRKGSTTDTDRLPPKPIHSLVLDTGPLIKNEISISTLLAQAEELYTIPAVLSEIRDEATRSRVQTTLLPFLKVRNPRPESVKFVSDFARKTGDLPVLSRPDVHLIALTYELECERNNGDWRLRREPGQKTLNGKPPGREERPAEKVEGSTTEPAAAAAGEANEEPAPADQEASTGGDSALHETSAEAAVETIQSQVQDLALETPGTEIERGHAAQDAEAEPATGGEAVVADDEEDEDDGEGWITPSNIKKHQARDGLTSEAAEAPTQRVLQACLLTSDFAMQNVSLRMNLNCSATTPSSSSSAGQTSGTLRRITHLKTWVLRCHGCFTVTRQTDRQFCPSCGQPTLTRTACTTEADGTVRVHLKRNFQFNKRGNVYSIPKPTHGTASGKRVVPGGGKNGWGNELILAEDQKEYQRRKEQERRTKYRDVMDEDYLPGILTGQRSGGHSRIKVGAGRNVNAKKR